MIAHHPWASKSKSSKAKDKDKALEGQGIEGQQGIAGQGQGTVSGQGVEDRTRIDNRVNTGIRPRSILIGGSTGGEVR